MSEQTNQAINSLISVEAIAEYIAQHSDPEQQRYVFAYSITITNHSSVDVTLLSRRWLITDANGENSVVEGDGVVGEQPTISAGKSYRYASGSVFKTPFGIMQGQYIMIDNQGTKHTVEIPVFNLSTPHLVN